MGIQVEFNPDLALRNISCYKEGNRSLEECIPENLEVGKRYDFLKEGQRNYFFLDQIPLVETQGGGKLSRPLASIVIVEATHFLKEGMVCTKGAYEVREVFDPTDPTVYFEAMGRRY
ncbi:MAG: hypothetical protein Q7S55_03435 [Nanoarchaeota archaeon]|nr:hypothetical protein [Nanoarchaeota archaeon]